jgi:hypothetical protein
VPALAHGGQAGDELHLQPAAMGVLDHRVAVGNGDPTHVELGGIERQQQGEGVVDPRIGVDDDGDIQRDPVAPGRREAFRGGGT